MSYVVDDGSTSHYPEAPWKESQPDEVQSNFMNDLLLIFSL